MNHMKNIFVFWTVTWFVFGCSSEETPLVAVVNDEAPVSKVIDSTTKNESAIVNDTLNYKGFIGDAAIAAQIIICRSDSYSEFKDSVYGWYKYDLYHDAIQLTGVYGCLDWCSMDLYEQVNGDSTGKWELDADYLAESMKGTWKDPSTGKKAPIVLKNTASSIYLHPKAKTFFSSEEASEDFFRKHIVYNQDMRYKRFYLLANTTTGDFTYDSDKQYNFPLPVGLRLLFDNADYYSDGPINIAEDWRIQGEDFDVPYDSLFPKYTEIGYEVNTFIFENVEPTVIYSVMHNMSAFRLKIKDIEKLGYHLEDEISWLIRNSESVFGFFPNFENQIIYEKSDNESSVILELDNAQEGHIAVREAKLVGSDWWGRVEYIYYETVPCTEEELIPKPTVSGWMKLYNDEGELTLDHYSRGC